MRRIIPQSFLMACILAGALSAQPRLIKGPIQDTHRTRMTGYIHPMAKAENDLGPLDVSVPLPAITLVLSQTPEQQADLDGFLTAQQDPSSPDYHRWLSPEQYADRFGASPDDMAKITAWLEQHNLHVTTVGRGRTSVAFTGSAGDVGQAFQISFHRYGVDGLTHFANTAEPSLPVALQPAIRAIHGLHDFRMQPKAVLHATLDPNYNSSSSGNHYLSPDDLGTIYNIKALWNSGYDGTGQKVVIAGQTRVALTDIQQFRAKFQLPASDPQLMLVPNTRDPGTVKGDLGEADLDLEWAGATAPQATLVYVYSYNVMDAVQYAIDQNLAPVLSVSYGLCEPLSLNSDMLAMQSWARQANAQGMTWMNAAGDSGGADCLSGTSSNGAGLAVDSPADVPEVTGVGGTTFREGSAQYWNAANNANGGSAISYIPETVWNETGDGGLLAGGGGASIFFPKPAWQTGSGVPDDNARDVPDIAFSASGNHDPYMVVNVNGQRATGGTSAGAPSFAGVLALLNQYLISTGAQTQPGLGNINPELYRLARVTTNVFHDITQGNNMVPCASGSPDCTNGMLGFAAGPGYDQASGLGSLDVYNFVTQWGGAAAATSTSLAATPANINFGDTVQLTATVTAGATGFFIPTGAVTFSTGDTVLGTVPTVEAGGALLATLTVSGTRLPVGNAKATATYSGDATHNGSAGSAVVKVAPGPAGSLVSVNIAPNPAHEGQAVRVTLTEEAGVGTTITGWTINGVDDFPLFAGDFETTTLPAYGSIFTTLISATPATVPSNRVYVFTGVDAGGRQWSATSTLVLEGPLTTPEITLDSAPAAVLRNPAADPSCQWSHQLILQEQSGFAVQLTRFQAGGADWTGRIQQLFGTNRLAARGMLQAHVCWSGATPPPDTTFELDGLDETGMPVSSTAATTFTGPQPGLGAFSPSQTTVTLAVANAPAVATASFTVNSGNSGSWDVTVLPANQSTGWLKADAVTGMATRQVNLTASSAGLSPGVHNATLLVQGTDVMPQFFEVPVVLTVGSSATTIGGVSNGASFQQAFAPGMILSVFGAQLAPSTQVAASLPLPLSMAGVSASVNGVPAPLYFVSPGQINLQVPYETGAGIAVLGVNNDGQVASFTFPVSASAPGTFTDPSHPGALVPYSTGRRGDTLLAFITGEGQVSPPLATGASPFIATPLSLLPQPLLPIAVTVGGVAAEIAFAGIPSGLAGATQINFVIPDNAPPGVQPVVVTVGGVPSPPATVTITP